MKKLHIKSSWEKIKKELKKDHPGLTDDDLSFSKGKEEELVGRIENRLGNMKRDRIIDKIQEYDRVFDKQI